MIARIKRVVKKRPGQRAVLLVLALVVAASMLIVFQGNSDKITGLTVFDPEKSEAGALGFEADLPDLLEDENLSEEQEDDPGIVLPRGRQAQGSYDEPEKESEKEPVRRGGGGVSQSFSFRNLNSSMRLFSSGRHIFPGEEFDGVMRFVLKSNGEDVSAFNIIFSRDIDLSHLRADSDRSRMKAYIHRGSLQLANVHLYIPRSHEHDAVRICSNASGFEQIYEGCENSDGITGEYVLRLGDARLSLSEDMNYFIVKGITGTGGMAFTLNESGFDEGSYNRTFYNASLGAVQLNLSYNTGTYTSKVFDAGWPANWTTIKWTQAGYYQKELPPNQQIEEGPGGVDMSGNFLLLHLNEDAGALSDFSGNENNGLAHGGVTFGSKGIFESALSFDGSSGYVEIQHSPEQNPEDELTIMTWVKWNMDPASGSQWASIINKNNDNQYRLHHSRYNTEFEFAIRANNSNRWVDSTTVPQEGIWYFVAGTYDGSTVSIYINGILENSAGHSGLLSTSSSNINLGRRASNDRFFNGSIDEVAIMNRSLSAEEIADIYKRGVLRLGLAVQNCSSVDCSGDSWKNITGESPQELSLESRFFRYKFDFETMDQNLSPLLYNVTLNYTILDNGPPEIIIISPEDGAVNTTSSTPEFIFRANDARAEIMNCSLWVNSSSAIAVRSENASVQNNTLTRMIPDSPLSDGFYGWWINCTDGYFSNITEKRNLTIDTTPPAIEIISPANETANTSNQTPDFLFRALDSRAEVLSCTLWMNATLYGIPAMYGIVRADNNTQETITANTTLQNQNYTWWINCSDNYNTNISERRFIEIRVEADAPQVLLKFPNNNNQSINFSRVNFSAVISDDINLKNVSLYSDYTGFWSNIETRDISGRNITMSFIKEIFPANELVTNSFTWNMQAYDNSSKAAWGSENFTFSNWNLGTHENTYYNETLRALVLAQGQTFGNYTSQVFDSGGFAGWNLIEWIDDKNASTSIYFQVRTCYDPLCEASEEWSWEIYDSIYGWLPVINSQYIQYRVFLEAYDEGFTPNLYSVKIGHGASESTPPTVNLISPATGTGDNGILTHFSFSASDDSYLSGCGLVMNGTTVASTSSLEGGVETISVENLPAGAYDWTVSCSDIHGNSARPETRRIIIISTVGFSGRTTVFAPLDVSNIENLQIEEPAYGFISFSEAVNLAGGPDLSQYVNMSRNNIAVDTERIPELDKPASLTLFNIVFQKPIILRNGIPCVDCEITDYSNGRDLFFNVPSFSSYSAVENAQLRIWDDTDLGMRYTHDIVAIYANYTNRTSGKPINGSGISCNITFNDTATGKMTFDDGTLVYTYNKTYITTGIHSYFISCNDTNGNYANINLSGEATVNDLFGPYAPDNLTVLRSERGDVSRNPDHADTQAGNISQMGVAVTSITNAWHGFYGSVSAKLVLSHSSGARMYDWNNTHPRGEIYASKRMDVAFTTLRCAVEDEIILEELLLGHHSALSDSVSNTFNKQTHPEFSVGSLTINADSCNSTNIYVNSSAQDNQFYEVLLSDGHETIIYTAIIDYNKTGYNHEQQDFQMIVGENGHKPDRTLYYFFIEIS